MFKRPLALSAAALFAATGYAADGGFNYVVPPKFDAATSSPFSSGVQAGDTFFVAGHIAVDPATGEPSPNAEVEARAVMDAVMRTLDQAGYRSDDLVSVTVYCTDLTLYDKFNAVYRTYFHGHYPARAFIGVDKLLRKAHFEVAGVAVRPAGSRKP